MIVPAVLKPYSTSLISCWYRLSLSISCKNKHPSNQIITNKTKGQCQLCWTWERQVEETDSSKALSRRPCFPSAAALSHDDPEKSMNPPDACLPTQTSGAP